MISERAREDSGNDNVGWLVGWSVGLSLTQRFFLPINHEQMNCSCLPITQERIDGY